MSKSSRMISLIFSLDQPTSNYLPIVLISYPVFYSVAAY